MKASASLEFLKAHAVISRSWLMAQIMSRSRHIHEEKPSVKEDFTDGNGVRHLVCWQDRTDHRLFDVCADDHCQRYQGLTMAVGENVRKAIDQTWGEVLMYNGKVCDARFSKCCGGMMERFSTCWNDTDFPYLEAVPDMPSADAETIPDLTVEANAEKWILGEVNAEEDSFCNTSDHKVLSQVLNDYDMETADFFRWKQEYGRAELSEIFRSRSGMEIGTITGSAVIGKELTIRKFLSKSHLKSSAFVVKEDGDKITFYGAGWGHGVGLCQIGAAVMSIRGYKYKDILSHYYPGSICSVMTTLNNN